ncbi:FABR114Cp [Eremothecium gossypii FDAG1]|nr:FABR114Cp [Eremothecium gossypii FDAG1]
MSFGIRIAIDRGGTFTDCIGTSGTGRPEDDVVIKLLSVDPANYPDAPLEGIRRLLEHFQNKQIPRGLPLCIAGIESIRMGTTLATNCLLERTGERCAFVTTKGFKDALLIGDQTRPRIFDLSIKRPDMLYDVAVEIDERVTLVDYSEDPTRHKSTADSSAGKYAGRSGEIVHVLKVPNEDEVRSTLRVLYAMGIRQVAIALLHSYTYPAHEEIVGRIAEEEGFTHISLSSQVSPMIKFVPRATSAVVDAYLTPVIKDYLKGIYAGLRESDNTSIQFMQSDGGLVDARRFSGLKAILSGPAGGVVGYSQTCSCSDNAPLIGFDMGGTSTDVSRFEGRLEHIFETEIAGVTLRSPQLDINTIAAGGSSRLFWENGLFRVGPESAGADPGPVAYRKGGPLTITDANLVLGRLIPEFFPSIFGPNEDQSLDIEATKGKFSELANIINTELGSNMTVEEVAYGFICVANESMARPIRKMTEGKGHLLSHHRLVSFGGAGGQHAVAVAHSLGIETVLMHRYSAILSAYGMLLADAVEEEQVPCSIFLQDTSSKDQLNEIFHQLITSTSISLLKQGFADDRLEFERYLNLRYEGTETSLMVLQEGDSWDFVERFAKLHKREFGFVFAEKRILVDDVRVRALGKSMVRNQEPVDQQLSQVTRSTADPSKDAKFFKDVYFVDGFIKTPIYRLDSLPVGTCIEGPAILADDHQTNIIPPGAEAIILKTHVYIQISCNQQKITNDEVDKINPVMLSIFGHRFMDIAEQMGSQLRKTSVSTNVKERLDFSCAIFDHEGNLVANAPHVPVHLGSMSTCIKAQATLCKGKLKKGDVLISNHPDIGGTHLPDITIISPVFSDEKDDPLFYVASRAHHADIGGTLPGSIPPNSKELYEEGAMIYSEKVVKAGQFNEALLKKLLFEDPAKYPGCSGSRRLSDNISDIKAQIAANTRGIQLLNQLVDVFGLGTVTRYMDAIQENAALTVKNVLRKITKHFGKTVYSAEDYMDDGSVIKLRVELNAKEDKYIFDFTGTSPQVHGNLNAPVAITNSAILYCLRCFVDEEIPLNQGCLKPITVIIPESSILWPTKGVAVVGGNVMTSQRVTDVILKTFKVMADSQGDCNNFTFGTGGNDASTGEYTQGFGYYETICGGHGAGGDSWRGPGWHGTHPVHTNMTNTRMTDTEIFERRYPVILREFSIRKGSGGNGLYRGGDGVTRDIEFSVPVQASILSERRSLPPNGLEGGFPGKRGLNLWVRHETGATMNIGGRNTVQVQPGDRMIINTPGGGGFGIPPN